MIKFGLEWSLTWPKISLVFANRSDTFCNDVSQDIETSPA